MHIIDNVAKLVLTAEQHEELFPKHAAWFAKYHQAGNFLIIGPFTERERAGVIIAQIQDRAELEHILAEDSYYPNLATYVISEFTPKMVATNIEQFKV
ncbi:hypothetical protein KCG52_00435 [Neisseria subflava]|uniref:YciI family protein n=1 Tax=Neisseria subflava TaxID=28449 RepID=UPI0020B8F811|nr:YciI family protein [Neisseria subflava]UTG67835.1 hypothetical protein KCG52_00435 [Neisseria subflava]